MFCRGETQKDSQLKQTLDFKPYLSQQEINTVQLVKQWKAQDFGRLICNQPVASSSLVTSLLIGTFVPREIAIYSLMLLLGQ